MKCGGINLDTLIGCSLDTLVNIGIPFIIEYLSEGKRKLAISLDTGSAIKGANRADLFTGNNSNSEEVAGRLKIKIYLYALIPYSI